MNLTQIFCYLVDITDCSSNANLRIVEIYPNPSYKYVKICQVFSTFYFNTISEFRCIPFAGVDGGGGVGYGARGTGIVNLTRGKSFLQESNS